MNQNRCRQIRFDDHSLVFVEFEAAQPESLQPAKLALARTLDISATGMLISTKESLNAERILRISVDNGCAYPLSLVGEVKWASKVGHEHRAGVEIYPSRETAQRQRAEKVGAKHAYASA
ncbi:MAG: hypothetical protein ACI9G5_002521 [Paracoccaceae bacterium]|jgi:hypothetical protein